VTALVLYHKAFGLGNPSLAVDTSYENSGQDNRYLYYRPGIDATWPQPIHINIVVKPTQDLGYSLKKKPRLYRSLLSFDKFGNIAVTGKATHAIYTTSFYTFTIISLYD